MGTAYPTPARGNKLTVSFGLVNVGVKYAPLVQDQRTKGHYVSPEAHAAVKQQYVDEQTGEIVKPVSAYDHPSGPVVLDPEDRKALESERDARLELQAFVEVASIDPLYFEKVYLLWPDKGHEAGYDLLCEALEQTGKALVGTTVLTKATKAVMLRHAQGCILAQVCAYDANVAWGDHRLVTMAAGERPQPAEALVEQALTIFSELADSFDLSRVEDEYDARLRAAIEAKAEGKPIRKPEEVTPASTLDLMEALKASVAAVKAPKMTGTKPKKQTRRKTTA